MAGELFGLSLGLIFTLLAAGIFFFKIDRRMSIKRPVALAILAAVGIAAFMPALWAQIVAIPASVAGAASSSGQMSLEQSGADCGVDVQSSTVDLELWDRSNPAELPGRLTGRGKLYDVASKTFSNDGALSATGLLSLTGVACGREYIPFAENATGSHYGAVGEKFLLGKKTVRISLTGSDTSPVRWRVKNAANDSYMWVINATGSTGAANQTAAMAVDQGRVANDAGGAALAVGSDERLRLQFQLDSETTQTVSGKESYLCADLGDQGDWGIPSVSIGGVPLSDVKGSLPINDMLAPDVSSCEHVYKLPRPVDDAVQYIDFVVPSASGVNPDQDPIFRHFGTGYFMTTRTAFPEVGYGIYDDRAVRVKVVPADTFEGYLTVDIS